MHTQTIEIMKQYPEEFHLSDQKFQSSSNIMFRELEDESVLLNLNDESYYSLNTTGTMIWNLLQSCSTLKDTFYEFQKQFEIEPAKAAADFDQLMKQLLEKQFGTLETTTRP